MGNGVPRIKCGAGPRYAACGRYSRDDRECVARAPGAKPHATCAFLSRAHFYHFLNVDLVFRGVENFDNRAFFLGVRIGEIEDDGDGAAFFVFGDEDADFRLADVAGVGLTDDADFARVEQDETSDGIQTERLDEEVDEVAVEFYVLVLIDAAKGEVGRQRGFVDTSGGEGVVYVGDRCHLPKAADVVAHQIVGIAFAVEHFVVLSRDEHHFFRHPGHFVQDIATVGSVLAHFFEFVRLEATGFVENLEGYFDFADVVEKCSCGEHLSGALIDSVGVCDGERDDADVDAVVGGLRIVLFEAREADHGVDISEDTFGDELGPGVELFTVHRTTDGSAVQRFFELVLDDLLCGTCFFEFVLILDSTPFGERLITRLPGHYHRLGRADRNATRSVLPFGRVDDDVVEPRFLEPPDLVLRRDQHSRAQEEDVFLRGRRGPLPFRRIPHVGFHEHADFEFVDVDLFLQE